MRGPLGPFCASLGFFEQNEEIYLKNSLIEFGITFADFVEFLFFVFFFFLYLSRAKVLRLYGTFYHACFVLSLYNGRRPCSRPSLPAAAVVALY